MTTAAVDVKELPDTYLFVADVPGLSRSDVQVQVEDGNKVLTIRGKRRREEKEDEEARVKYVRIERKVGSFTRHFALPEDARMDAITASAKDGILTIKVPRLPPEPEKPKAIEIQVKQQK